MYVLQGNRFHCRGHYILYISTISHTDDYIDYRFRVALISQTAVFELVREEYIAMDKTGEREI